MSSKIKNFFYGRRKGRKISLNNSKLVEDYGYKFFLRDEQICNLKYYKNKKNILEMDKI